MKKNEIFRRELGRGALFVFLLLSLLFLYARCVIEIPGRNSVSSSNPEKNKKWMYSELPIQPGWTEEDRNVPVILAPVPENRPAYFLLTDLPLPGDQRPQASGTAWAAGYVAASYYMRTKRKAIDYSCSPAFLYNQLNGGRDEGVGIRETLELLKEIGCSRMELMPYRPYDYRYSPGEEALRDASLYRIGGYGRVDYTDLNQVKGHLLQGSVVVATITVFENFITLSDMLWENPVGGSMGLHTVAVVGYDDRKDQFIIENSAGSKWGKNGFAAIPYAWFIRLVRKAYVIW